MRPKTNREIVKARADMYSGIRRYFSERDVLEVETPILSPYGSSDVHIDSFKTILSSLCSEQSNEQTLYLQTSPEFAMKRLLADGVGDCFQLGKVFRHESQSRRHRVEFTMLEWYRLGFSMEDLIDEVADLVRCLCPRFLQWPLTICTYADAFSTIDIDPHKDSLAILKSKTLSLLGYQPELGDDRDTWLDFLLVTKIEPTLGQGELTFLTHYPASMAALANKIQDNQGNLVAERFELYIHGVELANGFHELTDAQEQQSRFEKDNEERALLGKEVVPYDQCLIQAMERGLPDCSGVAVGVDRVLMVNQDALCIDEVLVFKDY